MGTTYEKITLKNAGDVIDATRGYIKASQVRETTVDVVVDTGAETLVISEAVQRTLGLMTKKISESSLANGETVNSKIAEAVEVCWNDRSMVCEPWVLPGADEILLGAIPLENMDLMVNPVDKKLIGAHGDKPLYRIR